MKYNLTISPAIPPEQRHKIQDTLKSMGYSFSGGGTHTDMSECDISFEDTSQSDSSRKPDTQ
jgi:hypothetical protein